jgi:peptidoglycan-associated lipoprotein
MRKISIVFYAWALVGSLLAGCTPPAATSKQDVSSSSSSQKGAKESTVQTPQQSSPSSSLEAYREGKEAVSGPLKEIFFDYDKSDLRADARETLKANAAWLKANPSARVEIEGHCDERGTNEYNLALGAKRAQAAKDYLVTLGIPAQRVSTISYGKELQVCRETTEACWQKNRRDRFSVRPAGPAS